MTKIVKKIIVKFNLMNILSIFFYVFRIFRIKENKIVFVNFSGKGYGDSPKYILEELQRNSSKLDLVWLVKDIKDSSIPKNVRKVKIFSIKSFFELTTAKIWINNSRFDSFVRKRKKQIYIQTWHGCLALKKIEYDAKDKLSEYYKKVMNNDNKMINYIISNSDFSDNLIRRGFNFNGKLLKVGTPRNDLFYKDNNFIKKEIFKKYNINNEDKIILYAPTFRNNFDPNCYDVDFEGIINALEKKSNNTIKYKVLLKLHPRLIENDYFKSKTCENIIDVTKYSDIQELIFISDYLITDYSSTMFEGMIANKSVLLFANDIDSYVDERGFYFNFSELPFKLAKTNQNLIQNFIELNKNEQNKEYKKFKDKIGLLENGTASMEVAKLILDNIKI